MTFSSLSLSVSNWGPLPQPQMCSETYSALPPKVRMYVSESQGEICVAPVTITHHYPFPKVFLSLTLWILSLSDISPQGTKECSHHGTLGHGNCSLESEVEAAPWSF